MLEKLISFLESRPILNLILILIYTITIVSLHDFMVQQSIAVMNALGLDFYNTIVAYGSLILGVLLIIYVAFKLLNNKNELGKKLFFLGSTLILMFFHFHFMFEMNIEIIHSLQYGILGFLLFPFSRKIGAAVVLSLPIMLLDEWYQYQVLYPGYVEYFEFNDIIMNIFGLTLLCIILWISGVKHNVSATAIYKRWDFKLLLGYITLTTILLISSIIVFFPENQTEQTWLILNQMEERGEFWITHKFSGAVYHVLSPVESFIGMVGLSLFYMLADFKWGKPNIQ
ncbi:MAG: hypothetical protein WD334_11880 [Chitinophagales bacterium]